MRCASECSYAGFWRRFNAYGIDATILFVVAYAVDAWIGPAFASTAMPDDLQQLQQLTAMLAALQTGQLTPEMQQTAMDALTRSMLGGSIIPGPSALLMGSLSAIYNIAFTAGKWGATPGKRWLGLKVTMADGRNLTLPESTIRHVCTGLSMAPLGLGYATMFFTRQKLALHDIICNTRIIRVSTTPATS